jgi:4-oxalomesaconate tautomerase
MRVMDGVRCMVIRGGTSKGAYFLRDDLPADDAARDELLMRIMGTPDARQIDGIGGAHPLTSKVAVVWPSDDDDVDVEYLFLQVGVDQPMVTDRQNCGNLLAGVAPFAIERGIVAASGAEASVRIHMINTDSVAIATFALAGGMPVYAGDTAIAGVPGTAAPIRLDFTDIAGGSCGALLPSGHAVDTIAGTAVTLIDNGMPVVVLRAADVDVTGYEEPAELEANEQLRSRLEEIRLQAGKLMNLGDVTSTTVPKLTLVAPPRDGGSISTRTFIPHRVHDAIGVLGAVSVATAALLPDSPANGVLEGGRDGLVVVEHPTGTFDASIDVTFAADGTPEVGRAGIIRTARKLMDGTVFAREY